MTALSVIADILFAPLVFGITGISFFGRSSLTAVIPGLLFHSVPLKNHRLIPSTISASHFKRIVYYLKSEGFSSVTFDQIYLMDHGISEKHLLRRHILFTFDDGCRSFYTNVLPVLEEVNFKAIVFPVAGFLGKSSSWDVVPPFTHLSKSEIIEISSLGHEIGSHGLTHADLTRLNTKDLSHELHDSKKMLEDIIDKKVTAISFPFGSWNKRVWDLAQEAGYLFGTICRKHDKLLNGLFPVHGVYNFDSPRNVVSRIVPSFPISSSLSRARIISHFAKGAPIWKFDKRYIS